MEIRPFQGYRFNADVTGNAGTCISPPYDVIDKPLQNQLYERNAYNIVRIIQGRKQADDNETSNVYSRAGATLKEWMAANALQADDKPALYAYVQDFSIGPNRYQRSGFIGLGKLTSFGSGVQPHEHTLDGPKADRLKLMEATAAQFGQIFMLYDDPEKIADEAIKRSAAREPLLDAIDDDGVRHRLFPIDSQEDIDAIVRMMDTKQALIADGHHRYETALNYFNLSGNPAAAYRMMTFVNMRNEGLVILPTHRLISHVAGFSIDELLKKIGSDFEVEVFSFASDLEKEIARNKLFDSLDRKREEGRSSFGIYANDGAFYLISLTNAIAMEQAAPGLSHAGRKLDVNILHTLILDKHLGIGSEQLASESHVEYIKDIGDAIAKSIAKVDGGQAQAVFFMNATPIDQVKTVASAGEKMPQKSTFFYPKAFTGLVIHKL